MNRIGYIRPRLRQPIEEASETAKEPRFFREFRSLNKKELNAIVICSGDTGSGKSRFTGWTIESLDPTFLDDWENGFPRISVSPLPLIQALRDETLSKGEWWFIDEPRDVKNIDWATEVARAVRDVVTEYRISLVNLAVCTTMFRKVQNDLRDLAHYWIRMEGRHAPGNCEVRYFQTKLKYRKSLGTHVEVRTSRRIEIVRHPPMPSDRFEALYTPFRQGSLREVTDLHIKRLTRKGYIK